jgi:sialate O-acetylesterase
MNKLRLIIKIFLLMNVISNTLEMNAQVPQSVSFERIKGFPSDEKGIAKGTSASFAGTADGCLIVAGGCNFPDVPAAEGGKKKYYQGIYAARITDKPTLDWKLVGQLPAACAYGVSIQLADGLLCIGGNNWDGSLAQVLKIQLSEGRATIQKLPELPVAMDNFTGSTNGKEVSVYDGEYLFTMDLQHPENGWAQVSTCDNEKLGQPVSGYIKDDFHVWGGSTAKTACKEATLHIEGVRFNQGQTAVPAPTDDTNQPIFLGGGAAINLTDSTLLAIGGVNKDVFLDAVNHPKPGYMTHPIEWYQFNPVVSLYDGTNWRILGKSQITARAGATLAKFGDKVYIIGGELKPGVRTPEIFCMTFR